MTDLKAHAKGKKLQSKNAENLTGEEGFLWSRIEGSASLDDILKVSPFPEDQSLSLIESLIQKEALEWLEEAETSRKALVIPSEIQSLVDQDMGKEIENIMSEELRAQIHMRLKNAPDQNPFEILDLQLNATEHEIKVNYLALSRKFHPDRYFRKQLGRYKKLLEQLFTHIQKAYAILKSPHDREAIIKTARLKKKPSEKAAPSKKRARRVDPLIERLGKAEKAFKLGKELEKKGDYKMAAEQYHMAMKLNPERKNYEKAYKDIKDYVHRDQAKQMMIDAWDAMKNHKYHEAESLARGVMAREPDQTEARFVIARCILETGKTEELSEAIDHLRRAKAGMISDARPSILLAKIYLKQKEKTKAKAELNEALRRDPANSTANKLLKEL